MPAPPIFPLRWESTGDQWWYASPIDWAAANGLYDVVLELLHQDTNLLIKLTSLRRIRRLETVWNDDEGDGSSSFSDVALCRCHVARKLLEECQSYDGSNSLIRAGYGGWLLYTAASAGDLEFVKKLLRIDPLLVFGEGEYGVTDILYAAARSKNGDVFWLILEFALSPAGITAGDEGEDREKSQLSERQMEVKEEMMKRAVHGAARGGHVAMLNELVTAERSDVVLSLRDAQGSTVLHAAAGTGQVEVVKHLLSTYATIVEATDNLGNTALHVAAYKGHLPVVKALVTASPPLVSAAKNHGNTFLHTAVSGFPAPGFKRLDRQMELMKQLVTESFVNLREIVNVRNNDGQSALHLALMDEVSTVRPDVVQLLMKVPYVDLNVLDADGMTPLDLLQQQQPRSPACEILIKRLVSAGAQSNGLDHGMARDRGGHRLTSEDHGFCSSPGTSFKISDSEIFLYTASETAYEASLDRESTFDGISVCSSEISSRVSNFSAGECKNSTGVKHRFAGTRLKFLLRWAKREESEKGNKFSGDDRKWEDRRVPLREIYSRSPSPSPSLKRQERTFSMRSSGSDLPSLAVRMKFTEGLMKGVVVHRLPQFVFSPPIATSSEASPDYRNEVKMSEEEDRTSVEKKHDKKFMNSYFCFGAQGLSMEDIVKSSHDCSAHRSFRRATSLVS